MRKAVLFDAGGTLIHMDRRFFVDTLNQNGVAATVADFLRADALGKREISRILRSSEPGTDSSRWAAYARVLMQELHCEGEALDRVRSAVRRRNELGILWSHIEADTVPTLEMLKDSGCALGVVSNADGRVAQFLENVGLARYFDVIVDSGVFGVEKPDPRIFLHALDSLKAEPSQTPYVGDVYEVDALGARRVGMIPIILSQSSHPDWDCQVIGSLAELGAIVTRRPVTAH